MTQTWIILGIVAALGLAALACLIVATVSFCRRLWARGVIRCSIAVVLVILAALILPMAAVPRPHHTRVSRCMSNLSQMGKACHMYAMDHDEAFPPSFLALTNYLSNPRCFDCPSSERKPGSIDTVDEWTDYVLVTNVAAASAADLVLAYCKPKKHLKRNGANVLFVDGSVIWVSARDFDQIPCNIANHSRVSRKPQPERARDF